MQRGIACVLVVGACGPEIDTVADLASTNICQWSYGFGIHHRPLPDASWQSCVDDLDDACYWLASDLRATYADQELEIDHGGTYTDDEGRSHCRSGGIAAPRLTAPSPALDARFELRVSDPTGEAVMTTIGAFAPRTITVAEGRLTAGQSATLEWSPATDSLQIVSTSYRGVWLVCYEAPGMQSSPQLFALPTSGLVGPSADGNRVTVPVPAGVSYHGPVVCYLGASVTIGIAECTGFASCEAQVPWPVNNPAPGTWPDGFSFSTSI